MNYNQNFSSFLLDKQIYLPYEQVQQLINNYNKQYGSGGEENFIKSFSEFISHKEFPYKKYYMTNPFILFKNLQSFKPVILTDSSSIINVEFKSEFGKNGMFPFYLTQNKFIKFKDDRTYYKDYDIIADFFNEDARIRSVGFASKYSPMDYWIRSEISHIWIKQLLKDKKSFTTENMREMIYNMFGWVKQEGSKKPVKCAEARQSKVTSYLSLFNFLKPKKVLDLASAYGERLIASIIDPNVSVYFGVDPNIDYIDGYNRIINYFSDGSKKLVMLPSCSECINIKEVYNDSGDAKRLLFDLVLLSPAPFNTEVYSNPINQAAINYKSFLSWLIEYLFMTIYKAYDHLEYGGRICITILDRLIPEQNKLVYTEIVWSFCQYIGFKYEGAIWWGCGSGFVPFWTFIKIKNNPEIVKSKNQSKLYMKKYYSEELKRWNDVINELNQS